MENWNPEGPNGELLFDIIVFDKIKVNYIILFKVHFQ